jgi:hypothetical protein
MSDIAAGRQLCEEAILKYIDADGIEEYRNKTDEYQSKAEAIIIERLTEDGIL